MKKYFILTILITVLLLLSNRAIAWQSCGLTCEYYIDSEGVLTIRGTGEKGCGEVADFSRPWYDKSTRSSIKHIHVEEGITNLGALVFDGLSEVESVSLPTTLKTLGERIFYNTPKITNIVIPSSVESIGANAFSGMFQLQSINIPEGITTINDEIFRLATNLQSINIPASVTSIGSGAFWGASSIQEIVIPENVTFIGSLAFADMGVLRNIDIPDSVTTIEADAFKNVMASDLTCNEQNLERYLNASGGLKEPLKITCTDGNCENVLKGTQWEGKTQIIYPLKKIKQPDGSVAIYEIGKFKGYRNKRIYTIQEAEKLSKKTGNTFKLRYK
ncbi:MAG: leucine-rich repeat domain-containing protein [Alphaproteobacteria bacterium]|nr:leucine-rich repeat domain-containing protein [Alphaproteobacteria bacterium]